MNWFSKIYELAGQEYERYLPTAFDESLTLLEKVNKVIETLNQIVLGVNTVADYVDGHVNTQNEKIKQLRDDFEILKDWLENEGLEERTKQVLNEWFDNGRLAQIINNDVFNMKADKTTFEQFVLSITAQLQQKTKQNNVLTKTNDFKYFAHRGVNANLPENTILAFKKAADMGFYGVELDIAKTLDGEYVIMHDETINRTTTGTGKVSDLTLQQIKEFDIDDVNYPNEKVPTLTEAMKACKNFGLVAIIEPKWIAFTQEEFKEISEIIVRTGMEYNTIAFIKWEGTITLFRNENPNVFILYAKDIVMDDLNFLSTISNVGVSIVPALTQYNIPQSVVNEAHKRAIPILSFIGENDVWLQDAINKNLAGVITDNIRRW